MGMDAATRNFYDKHLDLLCCPRCRGDLCLSDEGFACGGCGQAFASDEGIPQLYWPTEWEGSKHDVTEEVQAFYEETPFPNYEDFDSVGSLIAKARKGLFAKLLDDQIPPGRLILEVGCGTGQLTNFLSVANRTVFGSDLCLNSLRLGDRFREANDLARVHFVQMNLFRPVFKPGTFDVVISNGVLHHTSDPKLAFETIAKLVRPGGHILVGLYHRYGRLITDARRLLFRLSGDRFKGLDPNLRKERKGEAKQRAWFMDQYKHPHESKHTIGEVLGWLKDTNLEFVSSLPRSVPGRSFAPTDDLFASEKPGNWLERLIVEMGMFFSGSEEGGFFIVIARRPRA